MCPTPPPLKKLVSKCPDRPTLVFAGFARAASLASHCTPQEHTHTFACTHARTHTGNREVTVPVPLTCYSRPGQVASCSHSGECIHPLGGSQTKLRFLALPGSSIWPWLPLGAQAAKGQIPRGEQFARLVLRLDNGAAFLKHLMVHYQENARDWGI